MLCALLLSASMTLGAYDDASLAPEPGVGPAADLELVALIERSSFRAVNPSDHLQLLILTDRTRGTVHTLVLPPRTDLEVRFLPDTLRGMGLRVVSRSPEGALATAELDLAALAHRGPIAFDRAADRAGDEGEPGLVLMHPLTSGSMSCSNPHVPVITPQGKKGADSPPKLEKVVSPV